MLALVGARAGKLRESKAKKRTKAELRKVNTAGKACGESSGKKGTGL